MRAAYQANQYDSLGVSSVQPEAMQQAQGAGGEAVRWQAEAARMPEAVASAGEEELAGVHEAEGW